MAETFGRISPFRGIRYNQEVVDLSKVICPPYDIITSEQQKFYYESSSYNAIRLEYPLSCHCEPSTSCHSEGAKQPKNLVQDKLHEAASNDKYSRAAITFQQWLKQGVLKIDDAPAFYLHDHYFNYLGKERRRRGIIARVKLEPWGNGIYPHEETFSKAKDDRLKLLRACRANFSPLFSLYQDSEGKIASILSKASQIKPIIETSEILNSKSQIPNPKAESHVVWAITNPKITRQISQIVSAQTFYMADGHHRYETALTYQQEIARRELTEGQNYIMMELVEFSDPGLFILPIHRLVRGVASPALAGLKKQLESFFTLELIPETLMLPSHLSEFRISKSQIQNPNFELKTQSMILAVLGLDPQSVMVLKQRQGIPIETMMPSNRSQVYQGLSVSILNHIILEKILGFSPEALASESIAYTVDANEAYRETKEEKYQLAFLLNPPKPEMVKAIADARDRMPRKSTYFYPKLPAGLVINSLD